jgi:acylphosphatase
MIQTVHVRISGHVQGVGYRAFVERMAARLGLAGWVRNRRDGSVEAVFSGESTTVKAMIAACDKGPRMALVDKVDLGDLAPGHDVDGFTVLPTE